MKNALLYVYGLCKNKRGQALSEYALILALIAVVVVGAVAMFGEEIKSVFETVTASMTSGGS